MSQNYDLFIGTERPDGLFHYHFDATTGQMQRLASLPGLVNPMYLCLNNNQNRLYVVQETSKEPVPAVAVYALEDGNQAYLLNTQPSHGASPCHLTLDPAEDFLVVANYTQGNVVLYPLAEDGSILPACDTVQHEGSSINAARQQEAHAHSVFFDPSGSYLFVADLGMDKILTYRLNQASQILEEVARCDIPAGSGPRHLCFHPSNRYAFIINELSSTVTLMRHQEGRLELLQTVSTLPEGIPKESYCAAIRLTRDGQTLYASNRGHDSVTVMHFDEAAEELQWLNNVSLEGSWPRDISLDPSEQFLLVGHQRSDSIAVYRIMPQGLLERLEIYTDIPAPGCLLFGRG